MKTLTLISVFISWSLTAGAQAFHLSTGETLTLGFNGVDGCQFREATAFVGGGVELFFGSDRLDSGESLKLQMFENNVSESPVADQIYNPAASVGVVTLGSPGSWLDFQGIMQVSMLSGAVDISTLTFVVLPNGNARCDASVIVPEPGSIRFISMFTLVGVAMWIARSRRGLSEVS